MVLFRNRVDRESAELLCCFRLASKLRIDPRTAKTSQRRLGESVAAAVQLKWCWPTSRVAQVVLIVINRIAERDVAQHSTCAAVGPSQNDALCRIISSRTPVREQVCLAHCPTRPVQTPILAMSIAKLTGNALFCSGA